MKAEENKYVNFLKLSTETFKVVTILGIGQSFDWGWGEKMERNGRGGVKNEGGGSNDKGQFPHEVFQLALFSPLQLAQCEVAEKSFLPRQFCG